MTRFAEVEPVAFAVEACTGWRYVAEELQRVGCEVHLAEPAESSARGPKQRPKTDAADARHLRQLLLEKRVPESWIPPAEILEVRVLIRLYMDLTEERLGWLERIRATLLHQGVPDLGKVVDASGQAQLAQVDLSPAARPAVETALRQVRRLRAELKELGAEIRTMALAQPACRVLAETQYGVGYQEMAKPFEWKFTRADPDELLDRLSSLPRAA